MNKKHFTIIICLATIFLTTDACSVQAIQKAISLTQVAVAQTQEINTLQLNLKDLDLQQSDFPQDVHYFSTVKLVQSFPNEEVDASLVEETGRLYGWIEKYGTWDCCQWYSLIEDSVVIYQTTRGAQIAIAKFPWSEYLGYTEEINPPKIGDSTRAFTANLPPPASLNYYLVFSYRNYVHDVYGFDEENEVKGIIRNIAQILLAKLQASPLINP